MMEEKMECCECEGKMEFSEGEVDQMKSRNMHITHLCASMIIENHLPLGFFQFEGVGRYLNFLNPHAFVPSKKDTEAYILNMYKEEKAKLKQEMASIPTRISLAFDMWTSATTECYICLTAHFVDTNWKLNRKILNFSLGIFPYTESDLSQQILEMLNDWGIEKKIFSLTLDDSFANHVMQEHLKSKLALQNSLLSDGEFFHVHCFGRILNLIVQEGLEVASDVLHKIRESISYVRDSESRMEKFKECTERVGSVDISVGLHLEEPTKWNSTYLMLESALKYQSVFASLHLYDDNYKICPSAEEWRRVEKLCVFLLPFYETTNLISGTSYPTSNLCFLQVWKIQCVLIDSLRDEDEVIKNMAERMMGKFQKYWDGYSVLLALGAVLDPRMKFSTLAHCYSKIDASTCQRKLQQVKRKLYVLFEKYSSKSTSSGVQSTGQTQSSSMPKKSKPLSHNLFGELKMHYQQLASETGRSQLDVYLDEPNLDFCYYEDLDVLQWWKSNSNRFSDLSILARDLLSIPITTVLSESPFSPGSCFLDKYRDCFLPKNVEALICTRNWLCGFVSNDGDGDDGDNKEEVESERASNDSDMEDDGDDNDDCDGDGFSGNGGGGDDDGGDGCGDDDGDNHYNEGLWFVELLVDSQTFFSLVICGFICFLMLCNVG